MLERDLRRVTTGPGCRITALMSFPPQGLMRE
jgi:hypothetical protein